MSNIKSLDLVAVVNYNWLATKDEFEPDGIPVEDVAFVAGVLLNPSIGFSHSYRPNGGYKKGNGFMSTYELSIEGQEAISFPALERLAQIIEKSGGWVEVMEVYDIEDGHDSMIYRSPASKRKKLGARSW